MKKLLLVFTFTPFLLFAQSRKQRKALEAQQKADQQVIINLKRHTQSLAAATSYNGLTSNQVEYLVSQYKLAGLQPKGTDGFIQHFQVNDGKQIETSTYLKLNGHALELRKEYIPLAFSAEKAVSGMPAMALREKGVPWFTDIKDLIDGSKQGSELKEVLQKEIAKVASKGATALFLYNSDNKPDSLFFDRKDKTAKVSIPVIYILPQGYKKYFTDHSQLLDIELNVAFKQQTLNITNVAGYIDNAAPATIVVATHYFPAQQEQDSIQLNSIKGFDDNASGTSTMLELAKMLTASKAKNNNYLFLALGGTDLGTAAAEYWLANTNFKTPINYIVNLDMVGNYSVANKLLVSGETTSPVFKEVISNVSDKSIDLSSDTSGITVGAPSYLYTKQIPVLSFSTGNHSDSKIDSEEKVDYAGELRIAKFISRLIEATDTKGKIAFAKLPEQTLQTATKVSIAGK